MRIISQNGKIDVPYDMTAIHVVGTFIRMNMVGDTGKGTVIAEYNTPAKTEKAMEMLHEKYRKVTIYPFSNKSSIVPPKTFQFPADSEVEV